MLQQRVRRTTVGRLSSDDSTHGQKARATTKIDVRRCLSSAQCGRHCFRKRTPRETARSRQRRCGSSDDAANDCIRARTTARKLHWSTAIPNCRKITMTCLFHSLHPRQCVLVAKEESTTTIDRPRYSLIAYGSALSAHGCHSYSSCAIPSRATSHSHRMIVQRSPPSLIFRR